MSVWIEVLLLPMASLVAAGAHHLVHTALDAVVGADLAWSPAARLGSWALVAGNVLGIGLAVFAFGVGEMGGTARVLSAVSMPFLFAATGLYVSVSTLLRIKGRWLLLLVPAVPLVLYAAVLTGVWHAAALGFQH